MNETPEYLKRVNAALALRDIPDYKAAIIQLDAALKLAPTDLQVNLLAGLTYKDLGQFEIAETYFRHAVNLDTTSIEARQGLGIILDVLNKPQDAIAILLPLLEQDTQNLSVRQSLASAFEKVGNIVDSIALLQSTFEMYPTDISLVRQLVYLLIDENKYDDAISIISKSLETKEAPELFTTLGIVFYEQKDFDRAILNFTKAIELDTKQDSSWASLVQCYIDSDEIEKAIITADKALFYNPNSTRALQAKAEVLWLTNKKDQSFELYDKAIEILSYSDDTELEMFFFMRDIKLLTEFGPKKTLVQLEKDIKERPNAKALLSLRISLLLSLQKYNDALIELEMFAPNTQNTLSFIQNYLHALYGKELFDTAYKFFIEKYKQNNQNNDILERIERLGLSFFEQGKTEISQKIFEHILGVHPTQARSLNNLAFILIGKEEWDQAENLLNLANENDYEDTEVLLANRGYIYLRQRKLNLAIDTFLEAEPYIVEDSEAILHIAYPWNNTFTTSNADNFPTRMINIGLAIYANLATAYHLDGQKSKAIELANLAISADRKDSIGYRILGCLNFSDGNFENAKSAWEKALRTKKSKDEAKLIKDWLNSIKQASTQ